MKRVVAEVLRLAVADKGVREVGTSNTGPRVDQYLRAVGLPGGYAWCAAFVAFQIAAACEALGVDNPWRMTAGCDEIESFARSRGILHASGPQAGDVFLHHQRPGDASHTGFVVSVSGNRMTTIEGNTNDNGSRSGVGVFQLHRTVTSAFTFARLNDLLQDPGTVVPLLCGGTRLCDVQVVKGAASLPIAEVARHFNHQVSYSPPSDLFIDGEDPGLQMSRRDGHFYASARPLARALGLKVGWTGKAVTLDKA